MRPPAQAYDYVVVGAGSAGCVLANRLSADPSTTVLLLEAGGRDTNPMIAVPRGFGELLGDPDTVWHYPTRPFGPSGTTEYWIRGKTLGGSSAVNGMVYNRGHRADYDALERLGNKGWGWDSMVEAFRSIEDNPLGATPQRGTGGPLRVSTARRPQPLLDDVIAAGEDLGWRRAVDPNETDEERIGYTMATIRDGRRCSAADAFLHPVAHRPNLTVATDTVVDRVLIENGTAVGVRARHGVRTVDHRARGEVILAAGALASPKILQLSGVGAADTLAAAGIDVVADSPNVGARLREHRCFMLQFRLRENVGYNRWLASARGRLLSGLRYRVTRGGPLAAPASDLVGFFRTDPALDRPDAQIQIAPYSFAPLVPGQPLRLEREPGLNCIGYMLRPESEGSVRVTSADPDAPLDITANYFAADGDRRVSVEVFRRIRRLFATEPIARHILAETSPGPSVRTDEQIIDAGLEHGSCGFHAIGTCAMGTDEDDVVDPSLRGTRAGQSPRGGRLRTARHGLRKPQRPGDGAGVAGGRSHPRGSLTRRDRACDGGPGSPGSRGAGHPARLDLGAGPDHRPTGRGDRAARHPTVKHHSKEGEAMRKSTVDIDRTDRDLVTQEADGPEPVR